MVNIDIDHTSHDVTIFNLKIDKIPNMVNKTAKDIHYKSMSISCYGNIVYNTAVNIIVYICNTTYPSVFTAKLD